MCSHILTPYRVAPSRYFGLLSLFWRVISAEATVSVIHDSLLPVKGLNCSGQHKKSIGSVVLCAASAVPRSCSSHVVTRPGLAKWTTGNRFDSFRFSAFPPLKNCDLWTLSSTAHELCE